MHIKRSQHKTFIIPTNSMSDVAFLLLIFIMLVSLINYRREVNIEYPQVTERVVAHDGEENIEVWVDKDGALYLDGEKTDLESLQRDIIAALNKAGGTPRVHIIADKNTHFEHINHVISLLQALNYNYVSLVVKETGSF
ncbi:MAG: biopolymer transporter ExbD [Spirochaetaceae bacterium]|jgi:biopolymer transport protein ExbD|nr:biopolymer transporter ExbD [Spirochaetaceae bacterium]